MRVARPHAGGRSAANVETRYRRGKGGAPNGSRPDRAAPRAGALRLPGCRCPRFEPWGKIVKRERRKEKRETRKGRREERKRKWASLLLSLFSFLLSLF
jgi:hypothetical protein